MELYKTFRIVPFCIGLCLLASALISLPVQGQTLPEAVCAMLEFEPELNAAEYDTLSTREDQKIARSALLPHLSLDGNGGYAQRNRSTDGLFETGDSLIQSQIGLSLRQLLYDGGTAKNESRASRNAFLAQQYLEKGMIESRVVDLCEVYLEVSRTRRQISLAELNVENHKTMRDMLSERVKAGGSRSDLALVQGRLGLAVNTLATARLTSRLAIGRFERLTGILPENLTNSVIPQMPDDIDEIDLSRNHNYLAAVEALDGSRHRAEATRGLSGPKFYLDGRASVGRDLNGVPGDDNGASALVVGSWDIFSGGYNKARQEREHFQVGKFEELKRTADIQRQYELSILWQEREGSFASVEALRIYATELVSVAADYEEQFQVGRQELLNILDVQSESFTAESRLLDAKFNLDTSAYRILGVQGIATSTILDGSNCQDCTQTDKSVILENDVVVTFDAVDPDCRVPLTQGDLMNNRFDSDGPESDYESLHQSYYVERDQLPIQPSVDCKPKGKHFRLFRRDTPNNSGVPIFK
tara:strand:- start:1104 stop:2693 length:1590 start_codon:yes stop_codon:yes gene_type:complete